MPPASLEDPERQDGRAAAQQVERHANVALNKRADACEVAQSCTMWLATRAAMGGCAPGAATSRREARHVCQRVVKRSRVQSGCSFGSTGKRGAPPR